MIFGVPFEPPHGVLLKKLGWKSNLRSPAVVEAPSKPLYYVPHKPNVAKARERECWNNEHAEFSGGRGGLQNSRQN
jgi:hypothetical protein